MKTSRLLTISAIAAVAISLTACQDEASVGGAAATDGKGMSIVGSSTVFPFAKVVAERFGQETQFGTPVLESTGTGGGMDQFCAGAGADTPSMTNASRRMKAGELETCGSNGVEVTEIGIGYDGLALAQSAEGGEIKLTTQQIYEALAANPYGGEQTAKNWSDIDPSLPDRPIAVYGPPSTSGTRDSFNELIMLAGCEENPEMAALKESDEDKFEATCETIRTDGAFIEQGENDNLIVQKLVSNPDHLGIFGYSYMEENAGRVEGVMINGVEPTPDTITSGEYPGSRKMFIYLKKAHVGKVPGLQEFARMFVEMSGEDGPLSKIGLIALPKSGYDALLAAVENLPSLTASDLN